MLNPLVWILAPQASLVGSSDSEVEVKMRSRTASLLRFVLGAAFVGLFLCHTAGAQLIVANVTVDENGNGIGTLGPGFLAGDPSVLTYDLSLAPGAVLIPGDVLLVDGGVVRDVIRFNSVDFDGFAALDASPFTLVFYSDNIDGIDARADTGLPAFDPNGVRIDELGPEGNNGAFYTPTEGKPGYVEFGPFGLQGFTYHFISDRTVPEPATLVLLGLGLAGLGFSRRRKSN